MHSKKMAQAQLEMHSQPSMLPISRNAHTNGGRYCIFKGCFETRKTYNTLRDHLFTHKAFRAQMIAHDVNYENCCESQPRYYVFVNNSGI